MLVTILQSIVLGIVQGLAEFLPISSSAHLIIVPWLFQWTDPALTSLPFDVSLHLGTLVAVLVYFAGDWARLIGAGFASIKEWKVGADPDRRLAWFVVIGTIPGGIAGVLAEKKIEALFHEPGAPVKTTAMIVMAAIIALLGVLLWLADRLAKHARELKDLTLKDTLWIGLAQALAVFPGVSRSGSTITTGLGLGLKRDAAARFSFFLSAPIIAGAGLKSLLEIISGLRTGAIAQTDLILFPIGIITAAISGYWCIRYFLQYLQTHSYKVFTLYRLGLAVLILVVAFFR